jgi:hydroxymethylpyrimidine pyrophosphatase-like HAD family hydrolase
MAESTRRLLHELRSRFQIVLVTGGRPATIARRAPVMDFADAVICESGGVLLDRQLRVDPIWREQMLADRQALPAMAVRLRAAGWRLDDEGRTSALRVRLRDNPHRSADEFALLCRDVELLPRLRKTMNLEHLDIILASAGKANAVRHFAARLGRDLSGTVGIGDDVNDIEFLAETGAPHVLASAFPELLAEARRRGWYVSRERCIRGIDEILARVGAAT